MSYEACGATDVGRVRDHNEDQLLIDSDLGLFMVCDGMGGHAAGEVASEMTAASVRSFLAGQAEVIEAFRADPSATNRDRIKELLEQAVAQACAEVHQAAAADATKKGMGTTLVALLIVDDNGFVAHVGDSRLYLVRASSVYQLTEDHSLMNDAIKRGGLTREEAAKIPYASKLTQAVGYREFVKPDVLHIELMEGDRYLLCSDGLSNYMSNDDLAAATDADPAAEMPAALIALANDRGGNDNITAVVIEMGPLVEEPTRPREVTVARKIDTLKRIPLFARLRYKEMVRLLEIITVERLAAGEVIIEEKSVGEEMYVVLTGEVEVLRGGEVVATLGTGNHFGEMSLIDLEPRSATVRASVDTRLMIMHKRPLFALLQREPHLGMKVFWAFLKAMSHRLREQDRELRVAAQTDDATAADAAFWE